jgi:hypothetical protein
VTACCSWLNRLHFSFSDPSRSHACPLVRVCLNVLVDTKGLLSPSRSDRGFAFSAIGSLVTAPSDCPLVIFGSHRLLIIVSLSHHHPSIARQGPRVRHCARSHRRCHRAHSGRGCRRHRRSGQPAIRLYQCAHVPDERCVSLPVPNTAIWRPTRQRRGTWLPAHRCAWPVRWYSPRSPFLRNSSWRWPL